MKIRTNPVVLQSVQRVKLTDKTPCQEWSDSGENTEANQAPDEAQAAVTKSAVPALSESEKQVSGIVDASSVVSTECLERGLDPGTVCRLPPRRSPRRTWST